MLLQPEVFNEETRRKDAILLIGFKSLGKQTRVAYARRPLELIMIIALIITQ